MYDTDYLAVVALVVITLFLMFESDDLGGKQSFITSKNFNNMVWVGAISLILGVFFHLIFGYFFWSERVLAPPSETILELFMLQRVGARMSLCIVLGYALILTAIVLKILNLYFLFRGK